MLSPDYQQFTLSDGHIAAIGGRMQKKLEALGGLVESFEGQDVLDVGCDFGFWCFLAHDRGAERVLGIDRGREVKGHGFVDLAKHNSERGVPGVEFIRQRVGKCFVEHGRFDTVFCMSVYHHILNEAGGCHDAVFLWLRRHMTEGGTLIWEGPLETDDPVVQANVRKEIHPTFTPYDILGAAERYFDIDPRGPSLHETTRELVVMTAKPIPTSEVTATVRSGAGGATAAFEHDDGRRMREIEQALGWQPFPGSLNLKGEQAFPYWQNYYAVPMMELKDRGTGLRGEWAPRWCGLHPVTISKDGRSRDAFAMRFAADYYPDTLIELVAPTKLRDSLDLKDGDKVTVINV